MNNRKIDRNAKIVELKKAGMSFSEIGRMMGLSSTRVTQIYEKVVNGKTYPSIQYDSPVYEILVNSAERKLNEEERRMQIIVTRTYNCLRRSARREEDMMDILINADEEELARIRNLGRKSLDLIYEARKALPERAAE